MCAIEPSSGSTTTSSSPPRHVVVSQPEADARARDRTSGPQRACSSEPWRCCPRTSSTSRWSSSWRRALYESGRGAEAVTRAESLIERSGTQGNRVGRARGRAPGRRTSSRISSRKGRPRGSTRSSPRRCRSSEAAGDDDALYTAHLARGMVAFPRAQGDAALEAWELAARHARAAGIPDELVGWRALARLYGSDTRHRACSRGWTRTSLARAATTGFALRAGWRSRCSDASRRAARSSPRPEPSWRSAAAALQLAVLTAIESALIERLAGDPATAAAFGAEGCRLLEELEAQSFLSTAAASSPRRSTSSDASTKPTRGPSRAAEAGDGDDLFTQPLWRLARAKIARPARRARQRRSVSSEKRSHSPSPREDPERTGRRLRRSRGGAPASRQAVGRGGRCARTGARVLRAQGEPRFRRAARGRGSRSSRRPPSPSSPPAPRPRAPAGRSRPAG